MNELRLPPQASSVSLQTALTRTLDSLSTYRHAAGISDSGLLAEICGDLAASRGDQIDRLSAMIERDGGTPDFGPSQEAGFQRIWMTLVSRRFPNFREGLPRECERSDRRLERVLMRLLNADGCETSKRAELAAILREVRTTLARLRRLRHPRGGLADVGLCHREEISQDRAELRR